MELMVVVTIVGILAAVAMPNYRVAILQAKEAVLKENLYRMRDLIDQYYADKGRYPETLDSLVEAGYLRKMPLDPVTGSNEWEAVPAEPDPDNPGEPAGIIDVRSTSSEPASTGTPYNEW